MKRIGCVLFTLAALTFWGGNAMADNDPIMCHVEINYNGMDFGGHDDGVTEEAALYDAKEEACERACRKSDEACELSCMETAVVRKQSCKQNPKADKNNPKGEFDCRVAIRYDGLEGHAIDDAHHLDKAIREAIESACENACLGQDKVKKCEHKCHVKADVMGMECFDQNDKLVKNEGSLPPRPAGFHPVKEPPAPVIAADPVPASDVEATEPGKDKKADKKDGKKDDKKADKKDGKKDDKKADKKDGKKDDKKADKKDDKKDGKKDNKKKGK